MMLESAQSSTKQKKESSNEYTKQFDNNLLMSNSFNQDS